MFAFIAMSAAAQPVPERRVALVIGIGAYQNAPQLANPVRDARAIGEALRRLNFEVEELYDPDARALARGIRSFGLKAQGSEVALLFYAGHGVQVGRENYLLPADARLERERDLLYEGVALELAMGEVSQAGRLGIVMLDACRNNPFVERMSRAMTIAGRGVASSGLARVDNVPRNTVVAMATKADQVAEDGEGEHSPFASALLAHFATPGLELSLFFRSVRDSVLRATNGRQEPYVFSSLGAEPFYFYPRPPNRPPLLGAMPPLELRDSAGPTSLAIGMPTDPDQDPLTVRITGLPRYGEVRIEGQKVTQGAVFPAEKIGLATYKPELGRIGAAGTVDILVEDGRGGAVIGSIGITVLPSNRPPVVEAARRIRMYTGAIGISRPEHPDGQTMSVTIKTLPRGLVRDGSRPVRAGDAISPEALAGLVFVPEPGYVGSAGLLAYQVADARGGLSESAVEIDVMDAAEAASEMAEASLWERVRNSGRPDDLDLFLRLYPNSRFAATAGRRRAELTRAEQPPPARVASSVPTPIPAPPVAVAPAPAPV
ncbi:MAG TPA: caspase family protein, partial [Acetobacteraceae bacterium]|nr:caspase family protein [Acetobacteraceae bacterium]